jgi:hypothetical protein
VIFGLTFATFLTLVVVPIMYLLLMKVKFRFHKQEPVRQVTMNGAVPPTSVSAA